MGRGRDESLNRANTGFGGGGWSRLSRKVVSFNYEFIHVSTPISLIPSSHTFSFSFLISSRPIDRGHPRAKCNQYRNIRAIVTGIHKNEFRRAESFPRSSVGYSRHHPVTAHKTPRLIYAPGLEATAISPSATFDATMRESRPPRSLPRLTKEEGRSQGRGGN